MSAKFSVDSYTPHRYNVWSPHGVKTKSTSHFLSNLNVVCLSLRFTVMCPCTYRWMGLVWEPPNIPKSVSNPAGNDRLDRCTLNACLLPRVAMLARYMLRPDPPFVVTVRAGTGYRYLFAFLKITGPLYIRLSSTSQCSIMRSSATAEGPHDALCQLNSCQLLHSCTKITSGKIDSRRNGEWPGIG